MGVKDERDDFVVLLADHPSPAAAVFTLSRFAGPSVAVSRRNSADGTLQAFAVVSRNANVANGVQGLKDAEELVALVSSGAGIRREDILLASTGVIGRPYPMERIRSHLATLSPPFEEAEVERAAAAMMTTDTVAKVASASCGDATIVGVAKGVGMIEPDMATLITLFCTDAALGESELHDVFVRVIDRTFNALSIDTDTSTSDTAAIMAGGAAGPVDPQDFEKALDAVALSLTRQIAADGEGATTLIEVQVDGARDDAQAKRVGKAIVNSPLVKTAVHGADPNWGRVAMAIGKCSDDVDIDQDAVSIRFGDVEVYPRRLADDELEELSDYLRGDEVVIGVNLGIGTGRFTVYGCDLTDGYVRINADYTT